MNNLTLAVTLKKLRNNINIVKHNYRVTGEDKYKVAFEQLVKNYNEIIDLNLSKT